MKATKASLLLACCAIVFFCAAGTRLSLAADSGHRTTVSLNGQWDVADSIAPTLLSRAYTHKVPVPGLTHSATPAFADVDQFQSRQLLGNLVSQHRLDPAV